MASWYDYLPGVGAIDAARKGDWKGALGNALLPGIYPAAEAYKGAIDEQKQGDLTAAAQAKDVGQNIFNESMTGLDKAEGYYAPAKAMLKGAYGDPGSMTGGPGYYPVAPARGK